MNSGLATFAIMLRITLVFSLVIPALLCKAQLPSAVFKSLEEQQIKMLSIYNCLRLDTLTEDSCILLSEVIYNNNEQLIGYGKYDKDTAIHTIEYNKHGQVEVYRIVENNQQSMQIIYYDVDGKLEKQTQFLNNNNVATIEYGYADSSLIALRSSDYFNYSDTLAYPLNNKLKILAGAMDIDLSVAKQIEATERLGLKKFIQSFLEKDIVPAFEEVEYNYDFESDLLTINAVKKLNGNTYIYRVDLQMSKKQNNETPTE